MTTFTKIHSLDKRNPSDTAMLYAHGGDEAGTASLSVCHNIHSTDAVAVVEFSKKQFRTMGFCWLYAVKGDEVVSLMKQGHSPVIRQLKIQLNDSAWSSDKVRGTGMRRLALAQLGSAGVVDEVDFVSRVVEMTIRRFIPIALRAAASIHPMVEHKTAMEKATVQCEQAATLKDCEAAGEAAGRAGWAAGWAGEAGWAAGRAGRAGWAAGRAGRAAGEAAGRAGWAAGEAAGRAGWAAGWAGRAAGWAAGWAAQDKLLSDFAEGVVQVLIEMKAPGCQWLDLVPVDAR